MIEMILINKAKEEFYRSPIIVSCAILGLVGGIFTLSFGLGAPSTIIKIDNAQNFDVFFNVNNLFICIAYYFFVSLFGVSIIRLLSRNYGFTAAFLSIPLAAIINFTTYVAINFLPPTILDNSKLLGVSDIVYWCTLILFIAFCGQAVGASFAETSVKNEKKVQAEEVDNEEDEGNNAIGSLLFLLLLLWIWGSMVSYGQNLLITSLLPESWQPLTEETVENIVQESKN